MKKKEEKGIKYYSNVIMKTIFPTSAHGNNILQSTTQFHSDDVTTVRGTEARTIQDGRDNSRYFGISTRYCDFNELILWDSIEIYKDINWIEKVRMK